MTTPLLYGSGEMKDEPENWALADVAGILREGKPIVVSLEPGDVTNYTLLIVPCSGGLIYGDLGRFGIPPDEAHHYLFVSRLSTGTCPGAFIHDHTPLGEWDFERISPNEWTRTFLAWWFTKLWTLILNR